MTKKEKYLPAFTRPKRWFKTSDYKKTTKQKVFGFTASTGHKLAFLVPKPWCTEQWAAEIRAQLAPFLKSCFPGRTSFCTLIDGEKLLHGPAAKAAMAENGITVLPNWPSYSPDMNPQENVWAWAEDRLRELERDTDTFGDFQAKVMQAVCEYPVASAVKLIPGMAKRCKKVVEAKGAMTKY